jgi:hypothetical protein
MRTLQQDPSYEEPFVRITTTLPPGGEDIPEKRTRIVTNTFDFRTEGGDGPEVVFSQANIPNKYEANDSVRWRVIANATSIKRQAKDVTDPKALAVALANSKLAPAVSYATAYSMSDQGADATSVSGANARPGLQYGVVVAKSDSTAIGVGRGGATATSTSQAKSGQGVTVAGSRAEAEGRSGEVSAKARSNADSRGWYMAPGHAIAGALSINRGGITDGEARADASADLGTATTGSIIYATNNGYLDPKDPLGDALTVKSQNSNEAKVDVGNAASGSINVGFSRSGKVRLNNADTFAQAAVGNAIAGSLSVGISETGAVSLGDYSDTDDEVPNFATDAICSGGGAGYTVAETAGRGAAEAGQLNVAFSARSKTKICTRTIAASDQAPAISGAFSIANSYDTASATNNVIAETSDYPAVAGSVVLAQSQERALAEADSGANVRFSGPALAYSISSALLGELDASLARAKAETVTGPATSLAAGQAFGGVTTGAGTEAKSTTDVGNALALSASVSGSAFTSEGESKALANTNEGAAMAGALTANFAADSEAFAVSTAAINEAEKGSTLVDGRRGQGNAAAAAGAFSVGVIQGKAYSGATAKNAKTDDAAGTVGALSVSAATGIAQAQSKSTATAAAKDGNAQALAGALSLAGINAVSGATANAEAETGDVSATALSAGVGVFHGEARSFANAATTKCLDCVSDSVAQAVAVGIIADAQAVSTASTGNDDDKNKKDGNSIANAMAFGAISRTSNEANARVTVGPAQALSGGFAVAAPEHVRQAMKDTLAKGIVASSTKSVGPSPPKNVGPSPPKNVAPSPPKNVGPSPPKNVGPSPPKNVAPSPPKNVGPSPQGGSTTSSSSGGQRNTDNSSSGNGGSGAASSNGGSSGGSSRSSSSGEAGTSPTEMTQNLFFDPRSPPTENIIGNWPVTDSFARSPPPPSFGLRDDFTSEVDTIQRADFLIASKPDTVIPSAGFKVGSQSGSNPSIASSLSSRLKLPSAASPGPSPRVSVFDRILGTVSSQDGLEDASALRGKMMLG